MGWLETPKSIYMYLQTSGVTYNWIDSWRFVYSPSLSDCSTIIDDDLDSELEFLASASSVMVNPVLPTPEMCLHS